MLYLTSRNDLMADAFFIWNRQLMFASLHGRDADMLSFQAQLQVSNERLGFRRPEEVLSCPRLTTAEHCLNLSKYMTKYQTLNYGSVTHMFLYSDILIQPNFDSKTGWVMLDDVTADLDKAAWQLVRQLSDIPLLEHWQNAVLSVLEADKSIMRFTPRIDEEYAVVGVQAVRVDIPEDFDVRLTAMLQSDRLHT
ncbi:TPA: hypothetical protein ACKUG7_001194 [Neisseria gonorrhoeae]